MISKINQIKIARVFRWIGSHGWKSQSGFEFDKLMESQFAILMNSRMKIPYICIKINYSLNWSGFLAASCRERVHDVKAATNLSFQWAQTTPEKKSNLSSNRMHFDYCQAFCFHSPLAEGNGNSHHVWEAQAMSSIKKKFLLHSCVPLKHKRHINPKSTELEIHSIVYLLVHTCIDAAHLIECEIV